MLVLLDANSGSCGLPAFAVNSFRCWRSQVSDFVCLRQKGEVTSCTAHLYKAWSPSHHDLCTSKWYCDSQWSRRNHRQLTMKTMKLMHEPTWSLQLLQTPFLATPVSWNIDLSPSYFRSQLEAYQNFLGSGMSRNLSGSCARSKDNVIVPKNPAPPWMTEQEE